MRETIEQKYLKHMEYYRKYQDLADAMRIDGHEGMAKAFQRTANTSLNVLRLLDQYISNRK